MTVGLSPAVFHRIGLSAEIPPTAAELPSFRTDRLEPRWCGGDLLLQICSDDPMVVAHTARVLLKNVRTMTTPRWRQAGFRNAHGAAQPGGSMRNLMGQIDGTANLHDDTAFDRHVWDDGSENHGSPAAPSWSYGVSAPRWTPGTNWTAPARNSPSGGDSTPAPR